MLYLPEHPDTADDTPRPNPLRSFYREWVRPMFIALLAVLVINFFFPRVYVQGHSMDPSLSEYDWLVISHLDALTGGIQRGDIVTLQSPSGEVQAIKRVIGLPGELIEIEDGTVYVDGHALHEDYLNELPRYEGTWQIARDEYFVLGDNRNHSTDSADYGPVSAERIKGVALMRLFPLSELGLFNPPDYGLADLAPQADVY